MENGKFSLAVLSLHRATTTTNRFPAVLQPGAEVQGGFLQLIQVENAQKFIVQKKLLYVCRDRKSEATRRKNFTCRRLLLFAVAYNRQRCIWGRSELYRMAGGVAGKSVLKCKEMFVLYSCYCAQLLGNGLRTRTTTAT